MDHLKSDLQKIRISNVSGFWMVRFQIPIVAQKWPIYFYLIRRFADCVMNTMSDMRANPSSFNWEMWDWSRMFTLAVGSSIDSLMGIGTRSISLFSSSFSSSRMLMWRNSPDRENTRNSSISLKLGFNNWIKKKRMIKKKQTITWACQ